MKKITILVLIFVLLFTFVSSFGAKIDGTDIKSTLLNGTTMAPLEELAEFLELEFWPSSENYSVSEKNDCPRMLVFNQEEPDKVYTQSYVKQKDGSLKLTDEEEVTLPEKAIRIDGKLYVPYRFVLEYFGANVYWEESTGAYAYRTAYGEPALIRTNGIVRERVLLDGSFENAFFADGDLVLIRGGELIKVNLETKEETVIGESGKVHIEGDRLFVLKSGKLTLVDVKTGKNTDVCENLTMVGYLTEGGAWCEKIDGTAVYDPDGKFVTEITGDFYNPWEYSGGYVYYLTPEMEMRRAKPDGTEDEYLIKTALYPEWIDGCIYYCDSNLNYRRYDIKTGEDIMFYGLNLEHVMNYKGKYILNFYSENFSKLFIANPDGTEFKLFGSGNVTVNGTPVLYKDGIVARGIVDDCVYYITEDSTEKLTDDELYEFLGVKDGFVYYTIR